MEKLLEFSWNSECFCFLPFNPQVPSAAKKIPARFNLGTTFDAIYPEGESLGFGGKVEEEGFHL